MTTNKIIPTINLNVIVHQNKPAIELRKVITDIDAIKEIISTAYRDKEMIIIPNINNKALLINKLIELGLIIHNEDGEYEFLF